ncbi:MAG: RusA family crossover junction endodeoxyribonuclease [Caulobacteraceae bacterium]|nr:RusA family crossover junction endodeoxyribonuclease [Caulobacteraceae bacterium]
MSVIVFTVEGDPVPQPRARITTRGGYGHAYTPDRHPVHAYRKAIALAAANAGATPKAEPVCVEIEAVFQRPKSHRTKTGVKVTAPAMPRPDCDNIAKSVLDSLTGVAWRDDTLVRRLVIEKSYGPTARTTVRIG